MIFSMTDVAQGRSDFEASIPEFQSYIDQQLDVINLGDYDIDIINTSNARVVGVFGGAAPGLTWGGAEVQVLYAYDQQTQETGVYFYAGGTLGPSVGVPGAAGLGVTGMFLFDGPLNELPGLSYGVQGAAGVAVGYSRTPSGYSMVQIGEELGISAEFTFGVTFDLNGVAQVDWDMTEHSLRQVYGNSPDTLEAILVELAQAKSLGGAWSDEFLEKYGDLVALASQSCFGPEVPIDMWPLDPEFAPDPKNPFKQYDQDGVRAKVWKKPIHKIRVGDWVVSHDKNGNMVPGYVPRTFQNDAKILLDFHGTRVTPGHVYYRPDSKRADKYDTLIDVLRDDGMIEDRDGVKLRAATYSSVGGPLDKFVKAVTGTLRPDGGVEIKEQGRIRLGTRFIVRNDKGRKVYSVADLIEAGGGVVGEDELIRVGDGPGIPFHWDLGDTLPKPEDFVLAASGATLEDIYKAAEWENQGPRLPAPMVLDGGPVRPSKGAELSAMPRNEPLNLGHMPEALQKPQRMMNRKQRKAMEAKSHIAAKARKRAGS